MDPIDLRILDDLTDNLNDIITKFNYFVNNIHTYNNMKSLSNTKINLIKFGILCNKLDEITSQSNFINKNVINIINLKIIDISENKQNLYKVLEKNLSNEYELLVKSNEFLSYQKDLKNKNMINSTGVDINNNLINAPVITVENETFVKNSPIYFISKTNEFAIKINNNLIKGNIGNIFDKKQDKDKFNIMKCKNKNCNTINCKFYHDSNNKNFDDNKYYIRNYMDYSWNYIKYNKNSKINHLNNKKNTRFVGSRDTILQDLVYATNNELDLRNSQLMHDILTYQILNNYLSK
jgi:hypothetical protein